MKFINHLLNNYFTKLIIIYNVTTNIKKKILFTLVRKKKSYKWQ